MYGNSPGPSTDAQQNTCLDKYLGLPYHDSLPLTTQLSLLKRQPEAES
jgi:hypothetical protein